MEHYSKTEILLVAIIIGNTIRANSIEMYGIIYNMAVLMCIIKGGNDYFL